MRNLGLSALVVLAIVASLGYGVSHFTQELSDVRAQIAEVNRSQTTIKKQLTEVRQKTEELEERLAKALKPGEPVLQSLNKEIKSLRDGLTKLADDFAMLRSMGSATATSRTEEISPEAIEARKKRCQYVEEYLTKLEGVYNLPNAEERTEHRIRLDQEYKNTREYLHKVLGKSWIDSYEDALQQAYFLEDPVRNLAGKAKLKPLLKKLLQKCMATKPQ